MRRWAHLLVILITAAVGVADDQQVIRHHAVPGLTPTQAEKNSTGNLIFWSVNSLLQQLPNTRYINGHTITAATVPAGTILYHGRSSDDRPITLDWLATDPEHSLLFCWGKCYLYTYVTTRPLRLAYFDGYSAAQSIYSGALDAQDIVIWGKVRPDMIRNKFVRIQELCKWGKQFKLDGFVRMEMDFEIMICDFEAGMKLVSDSHLIPHMGPIDLFYRDPPPAPPPPDRPPGWRGILPSTDSIAFGALSSGMWHNRPPGETRVKIDYSRVISFFDPALFSLAEARIGKSREEYRLDSISEIDSDRVREQLNEMFTRTGQGSGIDWGSITQVIVDRYGARLELLRHILKNPQSKRNVSEQVAEARSQTLIMLMPYMLVSAVPLNPIGPVDPSWVNPIVNHCASTHTAWGPETLLTPQEKIIKAAVEEVLLRICGALGSIWLDAFDSEKSSVRELERFLEKWRSDITQLMDWLDWPIWLKCEPACGIEEICYIPTRPWGYPPDKDRKNKRIDMTPRCITAVAPHSFPVPPGYDRDA